METTNSRSRARLHAFSVTEMMVAVALMGLIVVALYTVFNQTQRALRASINQVDVLEGGRAAIEIVSRDLEGLTIFTPANGTNLIAQLMADPVRATIQEDVDGTPLRTNVLQDVFFVSRANKEWVGTGYRVLDTTNDNNGSRYVVTGPRNGIGTLARWSTNIHTSLFLSNNLVNRYLVPPPLSLPQESFHRIADGVIHLRLRAFDASGRLFAPGYTNQYSTNESYQISPTLEYIWDGPRRQLVEAKTVIFQEGRTTARGEPIVDTSFTFRSNALPAYLELELGVLDPDALKQYEAMKDSPSTVAEAFLRKQAGKVHIFRKRIPIRIGSQ